MTWARSDPARRHTAPERPRPARHGLVPDRSASSSTASASFAVLFLVLFLPGSWVHRRSGGDGRRRVRRRRGPGRRSGWRPGRPHRTAHHDHRCRCSSARRRSSRLSQIERLRGHRRAAFVAGPGLRDVPAGQPRPHGRHRPRGPAGHRVRRAPARRRTWGSPPGASWPRSWPPLVPAGSSSPTRRPRRCSRSSPSDRPHRTGTARSRAAAGRRRLPRMFARPGLRARAPAPPSWSPSSTPSSRPRCRCRSVPGGPVDRRLRARCSR